jgi:hypothetical protein
MLAPEIDSTSIQSMLFTYLQVESKTTFFECEAPAMKVNEKSCLPWSEKLITDPQS